MTSETAKNLVSIASALITLLRRYGKKKRQKVQGREMSQKYVLSYSHTSFSCS